MVNMKLLKKTLSNPPENVAPNNDPFLIQREQICPTDPSCDDQRFQQYVPYYAFKHFLCSSCDTVTNCIAEIGVRAGYSALAFLYNRKQLTYFGFDANNGTHGGQGGEDGRFMAHARAMLAQQQAQVALQFGIENVCKPVIIELDTQKVDDLGIHFVDFFHVDGDHSSNGLQHDLDLAWSAIHERGWIVVDDIDYIDSVREGVELWLKNHPEAFGVSFPSLRGEMIVSKEPIETSVIQMLTWHAHVLKEVVPSHS